MSSTGVSHGSSARSGGAAAAQILLTLLVAVSGCAGEKPVASAAAGAPAPHRLLLLPLNVVVALPEEVERGVHPVEEELRSYLVSRGFEVESPSLSDARAAWLRSAASIKQESTSEKPSFDAATRTLARQLAETHRFDLLIVPWIAIRMAKMHGRSVSRDGVTRTLVRADPPEHDRGAWVWSRLRGTVPAASLQLVALSPDGERLFTGTGGLDVIHDVILETSASKIHFQMIPRPEIFLDHAVLREGIAIAFEPLVPKAGAEGR